MRNKISRFRPNGQSNGEVKLTQHIWPEPNTVKMKAYSLRQFSGNQFKPNSGLFLKLYFIMALTNTALWKLGQQSVT